MLYNRNRRIRCYLRKELLMKKRKKVLLIISIILIGICLTIAGLMIYQNHQLSKVPKLTFEEALQYTTKDKKDVLITVGMIADGKTTIKVYGENAKQLPEEVHDYEIGSLTKTLTASLIHQAIQEDKLHLDDTIDQYLALPSTNHHYPTIKQLLTHTAGYKEFYFESPMISNFLSGKNDFYRITKEMVLARLSKTALKNKEYSFRYSNFGYAVLGLIIEEVYQKPYRTIMNQYLQDDLQLKHSRISGGSKDLEHAWDWQEQDAYLSAGAIISDISDMLAYAGMQLEKTGKFQQAHESLQIINASKKAYSDMGIHMDEIGMSWIIDNENNFIWHNGGTGHYNSYLGFNPDNQTAVVILSNLAPNDRLPATVLGIKLLQSLQ